MADPKITSMRGWHQYTHTLGRKMPRRLHDSAQARYALLHLTKRRGR